MKAAPFVMVAMDARADDATGRRQKGKGKEGEAITARNRPQQ